MAAFAFDIYQEAVGCLVSWKVRDTCKGFRICCGFTVAAVLLKAGLLYQLYKKVHVIDHH